MTEYRWVKGHVEVFIDGTFFKSADTMAEAHKDVWEYERGQMK